jgi:hypothetical protein
MEQKLQKKKPMSGAERQRKYLDKEENMEKHKERMRLYYQNVLKPKRDAERQKLKKKTKKKK